MKTLSVIQKEKEELLERVRVEVMKELCRRGYVSPK